MASNILWFIWATILCRSILAAPISSGDEEISLLEYSDEELDTEIRRRWIGGPWSPEDTVSILNKAMDLMRDENKSTRHHKFDNEAAALNQLMTGEIDPKIELETAFRDADFLDEPIESDGAHVASMETYKRILDMHQGTNGQKRRSNDGIAKLYSWFQPYMIPRIKARLASNGTRLDKLRKLDACIFNNFTDARERRQPVHGRMIQRWARQNAASIGLDDFGASSAWLGIFKKRHNIVSRKVTLYTSRPEEQNKQAIADSIVAFQSRYANESSLFDQSDIWNFDQTGFNYEPSNLRTLSFKGERDTSLLLDSRNKHTHSYTVQPLISRDGKLYPKLLIVTQEADNAFGPRIKTKIAELEQKYGNVEVYASTSGKLTAVMMNRWFDGTLSDAVRSVARRRQTELQDEPAVLLVADSWSGHSSQTQQQNIARLGAKLLRIPPQTTDRIQPLDVNFNRQLKIFYNRIMEEAFYQDILPTLTSREGIINVQSLIHNQLTSAKYRDMIRYAWHNTDPSFNRSELENFPPKMVNNIQFEFDATSRCDHQNCANHAFVQCAHCGKRLCLHHFIERVCFHGSQPRMPRS